MAIYKVGSDGKAPSYAVNGDYVVTGGGTYKVGDSSYHDPNQTTYNFKGTYDAAPSISYAQATAQATSPATAATGQTSNNSKMQSGAVNTAKGTEGTTYVSNKGQGVLNYDNSTGRLIRTMPDGRAWYVDPGEAKYNELYQEYYNTYGVDPLGRFTGTAANGAGTMQSAASSMEPYIQEMQQLVNSMMNAQAPAYQTPDTSAQRAQLDQYLSQLGSIQYNPIDYNQYMEGVGTLDDYVQEAVNALTPGYKKQYDAAYNKSMQNLNRAGLVDSVYGQALAAQQQNAITDALMAEAGTMGLDLRQQAKDDAYRAYQAAVNENQFGTQLKSNNLSQAGSLTMNYIGLLNDEAKNLNDYNMQAYLAKMQQYTAAIDAAYQMGSLTSAEYENMISAAKLELSKVEAELTAAQIANTNADTEKIKAQTDAIRWEMANPTSASGYGSGYSYGYGGGGGDDIVLDNGGGNGRLVSDSELFANMATPTKGPGGSTATLNYTQTKNTVNQLLRDGNTAQAKQVVTAQQGGLTTAQLDELDLLIAAKEAQSGKKTPTGGGFH